MGWENILKRTKLSVIVGFERDKFAETKSKERPNTASEMNKHKLFMQGKQINQLIKNRKRPVSLDVLFNDPNEITDEEGDVWYWPGFLVKEKAFFDEEKPNLELNQINKRWLDKLLSDIKNLDLEGTKIISEIGEY